MLSFKQFLFEEPEIIFEAVGKTTYITEPFKKYINRLVKKHGMKKLGSGAYGTVFQHPEFHNVVAKVFSNDPAYEDYLRWVMSHQDNKYVPQVIEVHYFTIKQDTRGYGERNGVVFMKKLTPMSNREVSKIAKQFAKLIPDGNEIEIGNAGFQEFEPDDWLELSELTKKSDPDFSALSKWLGKKQAEDVHNGNVMKDENGNLIFTDPVA